VILSSNALWNLVVVVVVVVRFVWCALVGAAGRRRSLRIVAGAGADDVDGLVERRWLNGHPVWRDP
jgi:hypothetical protein